MVEKAKFDMENSSKIMKMTIEFLKLFMCETLAKRVVSVILILAGIPNKQVTMLTGLCDKSVRVLKSKLEKGETEELLQVRGGGRTRRLIDVEQAIINEVNEGTYHTHQQIADMTAEKFGLKVSSATIRRLLKKNGIKRLKCGALPAKADPEKQRIFYETVLHPLMKSAINEKITLLFLDASHFVMGGDFLGYIYGKVRRFVKTYSGRSRYNVLGALNFVTKKMTIVANDSYITASEVCEMLRKIAVEYAGTPIYLILDNARYQKCKVVTDLAVELGIHLTYIPPYSPNLNLIERLWKHVKSKLRTKYYDQFDEFQLTINSIISNTDKNDKTLIDRLIGEKVQLFDIPVSTFKDNFGLAKLNPVSVLDKAA